MSDLETFPAVQACAVAILRGHCLKASGVTVGGRSLIDWRTVPSGETLEQDACAADLAQLFVALVGPTLAVASLPGPAPEPAPPVVHAFMARHDGARRRSFTVGRFTVMVEPHEDDAEQAAFTAALAAAAAPLTS